MIGKILIVDDVSTNRIVFKVKLTAAGYNSVMAGDGATCLQLARTERPDLILLDRMLPDMSGIEVLRQLKVQPADPAHSGRDVFVRTRRRRSGLRPCAPGQKIS